MAKMWAGRTAGKTEKIADDFNSSLHFDRKMYQQDIKGSMAHAAMLAKQGIISAAEADTLVAGLADILADIDSGKLSIGTTLKSCGKLLSKKPMKFVGAELFMLVVSGISMVISSTVANILPAHWTVSLIITCINSVQYGFIILSWPVYYLYYRWAFEE